MCQGLRIGPKKAMAIQLLIFERWYKDLLLRGESVKSRQFLDLLVVTCGSLGHVALPNISFCLTSAVFIKGISCYLFIVDLCDVGASVSKPHGSA